MAKTRRPGRRYAMPRINDMGSRTAYATMKTMDGVMSIEVGKPPEMVGNDEIADIVIVLWMWGGGGGKGTCKKLQLRSTPIYSRD